MKRSMGLLTVALLLTAPLAVAESTEASEPIGLTAGVKVSTADVLSGFAVGSTGIYVGANRDLSLHGTVAYGLPLGLTPKRELDFHYAPRRSCIPRSCRPSPWTGPGAARTTRCPSARST